MHEPAVQRGMKKRDGRTVSRAALEEMRLMALERMREGESPAKVAASFGLNRGWAYKAFRSGDPSYHFNLMCRLSQWTAMAVGLQALCVLVVFCIVIEGLKV